MPQVRMGHSSDFTLILESDQLRNIVTATIATLGLESFNADTGSNYRKGEYLKLAKSLELAETDP